jgi:DNA-3-methyladenine glycosylase II
MQECGDSLEVDGRNLPLLPSPQRLLLATAPKQFPKPKWERLQIIARATIDGILDPQSLRRRSPADALARLRTLSGVGPWTAEHVLLRGCGTVDILPLSEPRVHRATALALGLEHTPDDSELLALAERWRPFRTWVAVLFTVKLFRTASRRPQPSL